MDYVNSEMARDELRLEFLKDDLVFSNTAFILEHIEKLVVTSSARCIILDFAAVNHIDSSAVGMLISLKNSMQKMGKRMLLAGLSGNVRRIFRFLDITDFLDAA